MKKRFLLNLLLLPLCLLATGCSSDKIDEKEIPLNILDDNFRNIYEIFPYSFADSDGDGIGDLKGIVDKFDYIKDLNYSGLWLTPVHKSESYHKYDVDDYMSVDSSFGTLSDYDSLVEKCHENNMTILLDLVINHSSDTNKWFTNCIYAHQRNLVDNQYFNYYNVRKLNSVETVPSGYTQIGNLVYEAQFYSGMPDLNLQNVLDYPNGYLAEDIKSILKFWLIDHNVDGFRLDAVTSYFTGLTDKNLEFLTWLNTEVKKIKPNAYIVGEGSWGNPNENKVYYSSGVDGFFMFEDSQSSGYIAQALIQQDATYLPYAIKKNLEIATNGIPAPFIANHDTGRLLGAVYGRTDINNAKLANGILAMMNGCTFSYYGDEVGMAVASTSAKAKDEDKRQPLPWGDSYTCKPVNGSSIAKDSEKYPYGTIAEQAKNTESLLNYVKKANKIRLQNPEIARGTVETVYENERETFCVIKKTYNSESVYIALNCDKTSEVSYDFTSIGENVVGQLCSTSYIKQADKNIKKIVIPPYGIAIIR